MLPDVGSPCYVNTVTSVPSKVRNFAIARAHLQHSKFNTVYTYISQSPFNVGNASLFACLHGCAVALHALSAQQNKHLLSVEFS